MLAGNAGEDVLVGGLGQDIYVVAENEGWDWIDNRAADGLVGSDGADVYVFDTFAPLTIDNYATDGKTDQLEFRLDGGGAPLSDLIRDGATPAATFIPTSLDYDVTGTDAASLRNFLGDDGVAFDGQLVKNTGCRIHGSWYATAGTYDFQLALESGGLATLTIDGSDVPIYSGGAKRALLEGLHTIELRYAAPPEGVARLELTYSRDGGAYQVFDASITDHEFGAEEGVEITSLDNALSLKGVVIDLNNPGYEHVIAVKGSLFAANQITGNALDNALAGGFEADVLNGKGGADKLTGGGGGDQLSGESGNDTLHGDSGDDVIDGGGDDDVILGGVGADQIDGGSGIDTVLLAGSVLDKTEVRVDLAAGKGFGADAHGRTMV